MIGFNVSGINMLIYLIKVVVVQINKNCTPLPMTSQCRFPFLLVGKDEWGALLQYVLPTKKDQITL